MQKEERLLKRMTIDPAVMIGKPVMKGTRLRVEYIVKLLAHGATSEEIVAEDDGLSREDLQASLLCAAKSLRKYHHTTSLTEYFLDEKGSGYYRYPRIVSLFKIFISCNNVFR